MARKIKPLIYVFCEGESEIEYTKYLKEKFEYLKEKYELDDYLQGR